MQLATEQSVLGDFNNTTHTEHNVTTRFYRDGDKFMIHSQGADGNYHDYEVSYTFGVSPLQQYLIDFPGGRKQAFSLAWDSRPPDQGGQRWFHLYPDEEIPYNDELHWTGIYQNWNFMCAECHSTNFKKSYDEKTHSFDSSWSELNVSCEACHGPASGHLDWATRQSAATSSTAATVANYGFVFDLTSPHKWQFAAGATTAHRNRAIDRNEVETCARCHSRSSLISDDYRYGSPVQDSHRVSPLTEDLYFPDGQIKDEVYVYGSFVQSKMYQQGVTCSDCHNPHSLQLKVPGDGTCLQCHAPNRFATSNHHHHSPDSDGARCVNCHMPATTYMVVDPRRDHSFRIPRPDLSDQLGTPNACTRCHAKESNQWAAEQLGKWYPSPKPGYQAFAPVLFAARAGYREAVPALQQLVINSGQPAIARATAASHLGAHMDQQTIGALNQALADDSAMVRTEALASLDGLPAQIRIPLTVGLLNDPVRSVRNEAGRILADIPEQQIDSTRLAALRQAKQGFIDSQLVNADRPEAQANLGNYYSRSGDIASAEAAYKEALRIEKRYTPAYINLANLYNATNRPQQAASLLNSGLLKVRDKATLYHALGLQMIRQNQSAQALGMLAKAAQQAPGNSRYSFVYAIALHDLGNPEQSIQVLEQALQQHPGDIQIISALYNYSAELGHEQQAEKYKAMLE
jgi:tetratricopeptide (TPR) repeat protein